MSYIPIQDDIHDVVSSALMDFVTEVQKQLDIGIVILSGIDVNSGKDIDEKVVEKTANALLFARPCDNFQTYLVDLLTIIYTHYPHALYRKRIELSNIFEIDDVDVLRRAAVEKQVAELSYSRLHDLIEAVRKDTGCNLIDNRLMLHRVGQMMNVRNVITHNRGKVNKYSIDRLGHRRYVIGEDVKVYEAYRAGRYLFHCAKHVDRAACSHFRLPDSVLFVSVDHGEPVENS